MARKKPTSLIIVESPTKAKTISKFVGGGYTVKSSYGHVRDLPKRELGIDVAGNFTPKYVIPLSSKSTVAGLRKDAAKADRVILATDEDREGEAIAWHLAQALGLENPKQKKHVTVFERITFDEITKKAILEALEHPREINGKLVDAQQARRVLDRLVGYKLSPLLWKKISKGLSAGRVQSVALRFVADRERERNAFKKQEYWTVEATLGKAGVAYQKKEKAPGEEKEKEELPEGVFIAKLTHRKDAQLDKFAIPSKTDAAEIVQMLAGAEWRVANVITKEVKRNPLPPFTTSTLQQTAGRRFGFSSRQTMRLAQMLYEGMEVGEDGSVGLITYMRTDSVNLSEESLTAAKQVIGDAYGDAYTEGAPRKYKTKSRLAQEAHEAIRPTNPARTPNSIQQYLEPRAWKLYDLIWRRFIASQMPPARFLETGAGIAAGEFLFEARGMVKKFDGYQRVYPVKVAEVLLPELQENEALTGHAVTPLQHFTEPPPRYNEASLIKTLEQNGIGRPSTYAPTISVVQERGYIKKDEKRYFYPTDIGYAVSDLLTTHFPMIVDAAFTAKMEENLDHIASGEMEWQGVIKDFYEPFAKQLAEKHETIVKMVETTEEVCEKCGKPMVIRMGRFGRFMACSGFPECRNTKPLKEELAKEGEGLEGAVAAGDNGTTPKGFLGSMADRVKKVFGAGGAAGTEGGQAGAKTTSDEEKEVCEVCGADLVQRRGKYGFFMGCSRYPECKFIKKRKPLSIGLKCPKCTEGDVVARRTRTRKVFYGCSRYPQCDYATWERPDTGEGIKPKEAVAAKTESASLEEGDSKEEGEEKDEG